jgi:hypothetical protein
MFNIEYFRSKILKTIHVGQIFDNPSNKGTSKITKVDDTKIVYIRGKSYITIEFDILYDIYKDFYAKKCSSSDLKKYAPKIFDSKNSGHNCNCTFLFLVFKELGIVSKIEGEGIAYSPFYIEIKPNNLNS